MATQLEQELDQLDKDTKWLRTQYNELLKKFNERFVAIKNENIIDDDININELKDKLAKKDMELSDVLVEFIRDKRDQQI